MEAFSVFLVRSRAVGFASVLCAVRGGHSMNKRAIVCGVFMFVTAVLIFIALGIVWRSLAVAWGGHVTDADRALFFMAPRFLWAAAAGLVGSIVMLVWSER